MKSILLSATLLTLTVSAAGEACSFRRHAPEARPYYAYLVAQAAHIDLFRVRAIEVSTVHDLPGMPSLHPDSSDARVTVTFENVESIKGDGSDFHFTFDDPYSVADWRELAETPPSLAPTDLHEAPGFWTTFDIYDTPVTPACEVILPRFRTGELYAILRDDTGQALGMLRHFGRNFQRIDDAENDAWLEALRVLASPEAPQYGRRENIETYVRSFQIAALHEVEACGNWRIGRNRPLIDQPDLFLDDPRSLRAQDEPREPGRYWSSGLIYGEDRRICAQLDDAGEVISHRCPAEITERCEIAERFLLLPADHLDLGDGVEQFYWGHAIRISESGHLDFTTHTTEIQLTGELQPHIDDVTNWLRQP